MLRAFGAPQFLPKILALGVKRNVMELDEALFIEAIEKLKRKPSIHSLYSFNEYWLKSVGIPESVVSFFNKYAFTSFAEFGRVSFSSPNEIKNENTVEENQSLIANGLLIIGSGANGDPVVLDTQDGKVGFISHDILWEEEGCDPREIFAKMDETIGSFYRQAVNNPEFPVDYYQALDNGKSA